MIGVTAYELPTHNGDHHKTVDRVHAKYVLLKGAFMSKNIPKNGLNLAKKCLFTSVIQDTNVLFGFKLLPLGQT